MANATENQINYLTDLLNNLNITDDIRRRALDAAAQNRDRASDLIDIARRGDAHRLTHEITGEAQALAEMLAEAGFNRHDAVPDANVLNQIANGNPAYFIRDTNEFSIELQLSWDSPLTGEPRLGPLVIVGMIFHSSDEFNPAADLRLAGTVDNLRRLLNIDAARLADGSAAPEIESMGGELLFG